MAGERFEFRLLGPVEVLRGGSPLPLGSPRQRALLALLLLHASEIVQRERIVDCLWGERPPETATNAIQVAVHGLRKRLGAERLETRGTGYRFRLEPGELDLLRFRALLADGRPESLREALALWRGPPLADVGDVPFAPVERARLEERSAWPRCRRGSRPSSRPAVTRTSSASSRP